MASRASRLTCVVGGLGRAMREALLGRLHILVRDRIEPLAAQQGQQVNPQTGLRRGSDAGNQGPHIERRSREAARPNLLGHVRRGC